MPNWPTGFDGTVIHTDSQYDALNRLSTYTIAGGPTQTMGYDELGDIISKPGIGTYNYAAAGPHQVSSITGTVRGVSNPSFSYDNDGNMRSGPGTSTSYTSFDMPSSMSSGTVWDAFNWDQAAWSSSVTTLAYDSEHQRIEMSAVGGSTFYFNDPVSGAMTELYVPTTGSAQWRDYVKVDGRMIAERVAVSSGPTTWQYFIADHLGSIAVVTDASGNVLQRMIYDPWGLQLAQSGSQLCGSGATTRGYTGEEQFPVDCLVNLNARLYDPIIGRFMAADPVTSSVFNQQALNPYDYVSNNPLSFSDPNGQCGPFCVFLFAFAFAEVFKPVFQELPVAGQVFELAFSLGVCGPAAPACAGEVSTTVSGVMSGNVGKFLEAEVLSYLESTAKADAFYALGDKFGDIDPQHLLTLHTASSVIAHGAVGAIFSAIDGDGFGAGFLAAGVTELASPYLLSFSNQTEAALLAQLIGGTASVIGGGTFANGANTAAFEYLYNDACHGGGYTSLLCLHVRSNNVTCAGAGAGGVSVDNGNGTTILPPMASGGSLKYGGSTSAFALGVGGGWGYGTYSYPGINGQTWRGTYSSYGFNVGLGAAAGKVTFAFSSSPDAFFGASGGFSGGIGPIGLTGTRNSSGSSLEPSIGPGSLAALVLTYTLPTGCPVISK